MAGAARFSLTSTILLLLYGCSKLGVWADCCSLAKLSRGGLCDLLSTLRQPTSQVMDLNGTFFINNIVIETATESYDSIDVDIGTTSCGSFHDSACYVTCSSRHVAQTSACYVIMKFTCNVDNVKGRYVRIRQNDVAALVLCDVHIMGRPDGDKVLKNFALHAQCSQCATFGDWVSERAVDGNRNGTKYGQSCSHTDVLSINNTEHIHWWQVDLNKLILVSRIIIANRVDYCCTQRLDNFTVELGRLESNGIITYTLCYYYDGVAGPLTTLNCTRSVWGRFVRISKGGETLTLCEVEVYGDTDDTEPPQDMSRIPTDFSCDDLSLSTSLATPQIMTAVATSTIPPTEATTFEMFSEDTSEAKVSTVNPQVSSEAKVSTVNPQVSSEAQVSTVNTQVSSEAQVSTVIPEFEAMVSTLNPEAMTEAKPSTERSVRLAISVEHNNCMCTCWNAMTKKSQVEVQEDMRQTAKVLKVQRSNVSQQIRKKSSVSDHRPSSAVMGVACSIAIASIFGAMVLCDILRLCHNFWKKKGEIGK